MRTFTAVSCAAWVFACAPQTQPTSEDESEIANAVDNELPPGMSSLTITGIFPNGEGGLLTRDCHAVLIGKNRVLTAAHCFGQFLPWLDPNLTVFSQWFTPEQVRFHPQAWADGKEVWDDSRPAGQNVNPGFDLAIIELESPVNDTVLKLWTPPDALNFSLNGVVLQVGGHNNGSGEATGEQTIIGLTAVGAGHVLQTGHSPSTLQQGDSGGGATIMISGGLPSSESLGYGCTPAGATSGQRALVGISHATSGSVDYYVPVYLPALAQWAVSGSGDIDGDGICNTIDNCLMVKNADQANCNSYAEGEAIWESDGTVLGDACDPVPCTYAAQGTTDEVVATSSPFPYYNGDDLVWTSYGRQIRDHLAFDSVISQNSAPELQYTSVYFCICRNADGTPVEDPTECEGAPHWCTRDPHQFIETPTEVAHGMAPGPGETYWRRITMPGSPTTIDNVVDTNHPGETTRTWEYLTDYASWIATGVVTDLTNDDAVYGPGTDLYGQFWIRSSDNLGSSAHGLGEGDGACWNFGVGPTGDNCVINDHFVDYVSPDPKTVFKSYTNVPDYAPAPWWTYCAQCFEYLLPGDRVSNPARIISIDETLAVSLWTPNGAVDVSDAFSSALRASLQDSTKKWIGASEPTLLPAINGAPRAMMLSADGITVLGKLSSTRQGFGLTALNVSARTSARTGFAAAYSRMNDAVYMAGGLNSRGSVMSDVWTYRAGRWTSAPLSDVSQAPRNVKASAFSARDGKVWMVDDLGRSGLVLRRIDPVSGAVSTHTNVSQLFGMSSVSLSTVENGRVVLGGATSGGYRIAVLDVARNRVVVAGSIDRAGALVSAPVVTGDSITVGVEARVGAGAVIAQDVVSFAQLGIQ